MRFVLRSFEVPLVHVSIKSRVFFIRILEPNASSHLALMFFSLEGFMFSVQLFFSWLSPRLTLRHVEPHRRLRVKWNQRFCCLLHATLLCFWGEINTARPFCLLDKRRVGLQLRRRLSPCRSWILESVLLGLYVEISSVYVWETLREFSTSICVCVCEGSVSHTYTLSYSPDLILLKSLPFFCVHLASSLPLLILPLVDISTHTLTCPTLPLLYLYPLCWLFLISSVFYDVCRKCGFGFFPQRQSEPHAEAACG